ncbi:hypothetical protein PIB30_098263 [Stylosanthes scabra]|uniref:Uncharacterized protein n=1 Tax=Stylosanthes scabra TaxID=79078 RepID=A0ABU6ZV88_9FABA|nr:hypothetical protein [Stylosanthes scabra]
MTSNARHECLLFFAAFLNGGFPASGIPPEIIAILRSVLRSFGSSFRLSVLAFGLFDRCQTLLSSSLCLYLLVYSWNFPFFNPFSTKSRRSLHSSVSCPFCLWYLQCEYRSPLWVIVRSFLDFLHRLWLFRKDNSGGFLQFLHNRVKIQTSFREPPKGCEVLHEAIGQVGEVFDTVRWEGVEPRQGVFFSVMVKALHCMASEAFTSSILFSKASRSLTLRFLSIEYEIPTDGANVKVGSLNDCPKDFERGA